MEPFSVDRDDVSVLIPSTLSLVEQALEIRVNKKEQQPMPSFQRHAFKNPLEKLLRQLYRVPFFRWRKSLEIRVTEEGAKAVVPSSCVQKSIRTWSCRLTTHKSVQLLFVLGIQAGKTFPATTEIFASS